MIDVDNNKRLKFEDGAAKRPFNAEEFPYDVAFGLPWEWENFVHRACNSEHPFLQDSGVASELEEAIEAHMRLNEHQLCKYRKDWCKKWLLRAKQLDSEEIASRAKRPKHVADMTQTKRVLLTREILQDIGYQDIKCLDLIETGSTLAGDIQRCDIFKAQYKPCLMALDQLQKDSRSRNEYIMKMTVSAGSDELDRQLLEETREELSKGWAEGPFSIDELEDGATVSRHFPLIQGKKTRMIDDISTSGVNDSCATFNKIDLHVVDTFSSVVRKFFHRCANCGKSGDLLGKTYDLKSAYRQVPISVYNLEGKAQIYRLKTLPFGATHSVYSFLRCYRMLYSIAVQGLRLLTTNFYDDFILASPPCLKESAQNSMELVFMLTGWEFARSGKKCTQFDLICRALGVQFDFTFTRDRLLLVGNTESRRDELLSMISSAIDKGLLDKGTCLTLRGRLGFADSFLHGRLGALVLKRLSEHAHGRTSKLDPDLILWLKAMAERLNLGEPRKVTCNIKEKWFIYTDETIRTRN